MFKKISPVKFYKAARRKFLEGPDWVSLPSYLVGTGYRSPTVLTFMWIYAAILRFFTVPGRIIVPVCFFVISYVMIMIVTGNPIRILAFGLSSLIVADFLLGFIFRPRKISVKRVIPPRVRTGYPFEIEYELCNEGKKPLWNIVADNAPYPDGIENAGAITSLPLLESGRKFFLKRNYVAARRGAYKIYSPIIETIFPFGIFKWSCRGKAADAVIAYPDFPELSGIVLPTGGRYQIDGNITLSKIGESSDFIGCREFRPGDNPKHIHWPSSARAGNLIVREFQEEYLSRVAVIADTYIPPESIIDVLRKRSKRKKFEAAVALCAAVTNYLSKSDYLIDLFAAGPNVYHLRGGRNLAKFEYMLDVIACLEPNRKEPISELSSDILEIISEIGSAILILLKWDEPRKTLWRQLCENRISVKTIIISDSAEEIPSAFIRFSPEMILNKEIKSI